MSAPPSMQTPSEAANSQWEGRTIALCSGGLYQALSIGFNPPGDELIKRLIEAENNFDLANLVAVLDIDAAHPNSVNLSKRVTALSTFADKRALDSLQQAYTALFGHTPHSQVPLHETEYGEETLFQQPYQLADIAGFYSAFGLYLPAPLHERVDHISCECEFMSFLGCKEAYALENNDQSMLAETRKAQRLFLRDHLGRFVPSLSNLIMRANQHGFYSALAEVLKCWPQLQAKTHRCLVLPSGSIRETRAELYYAAQETALSERERRTIIIQVTPEVLARPSEFLDSLRHEMLHIVDMLDDTFGYDPAFIGRAAGPRYDNVLWQRYSLLWSITVDGRLFNNRWSTDTKRNKLFKGFERLFPGDRISQETMFSFFYSGGPHTHQSLLAATCNSQVHCPLCHFPSCDFINVGLDSPGVISLIQKDNPNWRLNEPVCVQCFDLYTARQVRTVLPYV